MEVLLFVIGIVTMPIWIPYLMGTVALTIGLILGTIEFLFSKDK